jgi:hypothetical protein
LVGTKLNVALLSFRSGNRRRPNQIWVETEVYGIPVESRTYLRDVLMDIAYATNIVENISNEYSWREGGTRILCL